jgi:hypothetical protein
MRVGTCVGNTGWAAHKLLPPLGGDFEGGGLEGGGLEGGGLEGGGLEVGGAPEESIVGTLDVA